VLRVVLWTTPIRSRVWDKPVPGVFAAGCASMAVSDSGNPHQMQQPINDRIYLIRRQGLRSTKGLEGKSNPRRLLQKANSC